MFVVSRTGSFAIYVAPRRVLMDTGAQPVMIGKLLADVLGLTASDLKPCPFTILTSLGGTEWATGQTKEPIHLIFHVEAGPTYSHLFLKCMVTRATNYNILVGQQGLYPLGFGLDNWPEEAWIRLGWSSGDRRNEMIPVTFGALAMFMAIEVVFGCTITTDYLPSEAT